MHICETTWFLESASRCQNGERVPRFVRNLFRNALFSNISNSFYFLSNPVVWCATLQSAGIIKCHTMRHMFTRLHLNNIYCQLWIRLIQYLLLEVVIKTMPWLITIATGRSEPKDIMVMWSDYFCLEVNSADGFFWIAWRDCLRLLFFRGSVVK